MRAATTETLKVFVEKARKLNSLSLTKSVKESGGVGLHYYWEAGKENILIELRGPDDEAIDAFVLTLRLFLQDNERISFHSMALKILDDPDLSANLKVFFSKARALLNQYLDEHTEPLLNIDTGAPLTRRHIMDVFLYGGLAHTNKDKKLEFDRWKSIPFFFPFTQNEFNCILLSVFGIIDHVSYWIEEELKVQ